MELFFYVRELKSWSFNKATFASEHEGCAAVVKVGNSGTLFKRLSRSELLNPLFFEMWLTRYSFYGIEMIAPIVFGREDDEENMWDGTRSFCFNHGTIS
jgi:hypothetical protein